MENKNIEKIEKVEKAAKALDKGVEAADKQLAAVPSMMGEHRPKIMVGLVVLMVIALLRDPSLAIIGLLLVGFLYSSSILGAVKKQALKKKADKAVLVVEASVEVKKEEELK